MIMGAVKDDYPALFAYNVWASRRTLKSLQALPAEDYTRDLGGGVTIRHTLVHVVGSTWAWSRRLADGVDAAAPGEDALPDLASAMALLGEAEERLTQFVATVTPERLAETLRWTTSAGERSAPVWSILRHVVNHGSYHRGQIALLVRMAGGRPAATDLALWGIRTAEDSAS